MPHILVIEDEPLLARNICESLRLAGYTASSTSSGEDGLEAAEKDPPDVLLLDLRLPGMDGLEVLRELRARGNSTSVVIMTAYGRIDDAITAMRLGASDYLTKPLDLKELDLVVGRVLDQRRLTANLDYLRTRERRLSGLDGVIGESEPMQAVKRLISRIVSTQALASELPPSVLLLGETGTGKDLIARAIHYAGPRRDRPFVHINCTALPESLAEAELFGHVKGAFTDARGDKRGLFEVADGGTLYLDEIGHTRPGLQAKLLGALENRTIRPVGSTSERQINVHVIAASNRDLEEAIRQEEFREDLYHRLRVLTVNLPALRERGNDIRLLADHFLEVYSTRFGVPRKRLTAEAYTLMASYGWPGNVRQLSHTIESALLISEGSAIGTEHLGIQIIRPAPLRVEVPGVEQVELDFDSETCPKLEDVEHQIIESAVRHCHNNLSRAARVLGISRDAIRYRLERYGKGNATEAG